MSHATHYRSYRGSQLISWLLVPVFTGKMSQPTDHYVTTLGTYTVQTRNTKYKGTDGRVYAQ